ncbi:MAG: low specificity L-threonine aldolase [SAR202 cluster bacterium]|nr:low specificity L-threonine aldolase [SAR202 cluster bacterium]
MIKKPGLADKATDQRNNPNAVVFAGDGEPQIPQSVVARITGLLRSDKLQPDTYSIGGSVEILESRIAQELGMEAAIWMPTGTLANQIALRHHCGTKSRIVLQEQSHIYHDEGDALVKLSGLNAIPLAYGRPYFSVNELRQALKEATSGRVLNHVGAVSIESPVRRQAGQVVPWNEMQSITKLCHDQGIPVHLDAARLYMMSAATGINVKKYASLFDSVYVSLYKYFGAPFGAILAGPHQFIENMFHDRRMFGGGLPSSYLSAALALEGMNGFPDRFDESFNKAKALFKIINKLPDIEIRKFQNGSNIFELLLTKNINTDQLINNLLNFDIVIPETKNDWPVPLIHINTTILRKPNSEIAKAFSNAIRESIEPA